MLYKKKTNHKSERLNISWVRRSGNKAAHTLANQACSEPNQIWLNEAPLVLGKEVCYLDLLLLLAGPRRDQNALISICILGNEGNIVVTEMPIF
jgi:hypothetical protein